MKSLHILSKNRFGGLIAAFITLSFTSISADAQILFNNGAPFGAPFLIGSTPFDDANNVAGDIFTPTLSGTANTLTLAGGYEQFQLPTSDNFTIRLYSVSSGAPSTLISTSTLSDVSRSEIGIGHGGTTPVYDFTGTLNTPFSLSTGTSYYLGISDTTSPDEGFILWSSSGIATSEWVSENNGSTFSGGNDPLSFSLSEAPEPSTWVMLLGGLGLLAFFRLRTEIKKKGTGEIQTPQF